MTNWHRIFMVIVSQMARGAVEGAPPRRLVRSCGGGAGQRGHGGAEAMGALAGEETGEGAPLDEDKARRGEVGSRRWPNGEARRGRRRGAAWERQRAAGGGAGMPPAAYARERDAEVWAAACRPTR
ncbi:unnamed protein product [Urochloa humidicola]